MPSISMTPRAAKCRIDSFSRAGQLVLMQRLAASPSARTTSLPHTGHLCGILNARRCSPSFTTRTTFGITSPERSTSTVSPIFKPSRSISSSLCSVARETVTPLDVHRPQVRDGRQRAGAAHLDADILHHGLFLPRRELVGDGPARSFRGPAQPRLLLDRIDFRDHAVDLVRQRIALLLPIRCRIRPAPRYPGTACAADSP